VRAEIDRLEGRDLDAMLSYERAVRSARENGFVQNEALSNELAGRFYLDRGLETNGYAHLRNARACYTLWGADGKVRQLERLHTRLTAPEGPRPAASVDSSVQQLDVTTVVKASQAVSSEIVMAKLVETLMTIALDAPAFHRRLPGRECRVQGRRRFVAKFLHPERAQFRYPRPPAQHLAASLFLALAAAGAGGWTIRQIVLCAQRGDLRGLDKLSGQSTASSVPKWLTFCLQWFLFQ
jgi:hypothetical protein